MGENWFRHNPTEVVAKNRVEVIYDQTILTIRPVGANRPDILIKDIGNKTAYIIQYKSLKVNRNGGKSKKYQSASVASPVEDLHSIYQKPFSK